MSWLKAAALSGEDVFDEAGDEMKLQSKEWSSNMDKRVKDGYVDGLNAGEDAALQLGFNQGFREGAARTVAVGRLKGIISAIWCWCQIEHPDTPVPARVTELLQRVSQHEDRIADGIRKSMENPPPSVSDISESMEDLEVKQADPSCCGDGGCGEETECCSRGDKMDQGIPQRPQRLCSGSADRSSCSDEDLSLLLQSCMDLVSELELPEELLSHIQELKDI